MIKKNIHDKRNNTCDTGGVGGVIGCGGMVFLCSIKFRPYVGDCYQWNKQIFYHMYHTQEQKSSELFSYKIEIRVACQ